MRFEGIRQSLSSAGAWISACAQTAKTAVNTQCQRLRTSVSRGFDSVSNFFAGIRDRVSSLFGRVSTTPTKEAARTEEAANPILQGRAANGGAPIEETGLGAVQREDFVPTFPPAGDDDVDSHDVAPFNAVDHEEGLGVRAVDAASNDELIHAFMLAQGTQ